jgi:CBS domain-containing protein
MFIEDIMKAPVVTCAMRDTLDKVAGLMWDGDCGAIVVVEGSRPIAMITDRDICMAAYTSGKKLSDIRVSTAASRVVHALRDTDPLDQAEALMRDAQVRRVPVVDKSGALVGILTANDLICNAGTLGRRRHALSAETLVRTLAGICAPTPIATATSAPQAITTIARAVTST